MEPLKEHTIPFTGLKDGSHAFRFHLDSAYFSLEGTEDFEDGTVTVDVELEKTPTMIIASIHVEGPVIVRCDRCDVPMEHHLQGDQRQIFQLNSEESVDDDELVALPPHVHSVNLTHYIYECLRLSLPVRHVHPPGQCDPEVEATLEKLAVDHEPIPDPRWEALKTLKNQRP